MVNYSVTAVGAFNGGIDGRKVAHGQDGGAGKGTHEAELDSGLLENFVLVLLAECHEVGHVNFVEGSEGRSGILGLLEALGDAETHAVHLDLQNG